MPRKTDSSNPRDWLFLCGQDLAGIRELAAKEIAYEMCRSKLAEVIEKLLKAALIHRGWFLEKSHDLSHLAGALAQRDPDLAESLRALVNEYADAYSVGRYPGFDLEDADWGAMRRHLSVVAAALGTIRAQIADRAERVCRGVD